MSGPNTLPPRPSRNLDLIATTPVPIVAMCVHQERLFVATSGGVFERGEDGVFRECRFERLDKL